MEKTIRNKAANSKKDSFTLSAPGVRRKSSKTFGLVLGATSLGLMALGGCTPAGVAVGVGATAATAASQERGFQGALQDTETRLDINHLFLQESETLFTDINLQVQEGRVLLTGAVEKPETELMAVRLAWQGKGVREVINEIEVTDQSSVGDVARDLWIETQLEGKLLIDSGVTSINYSVESVNNTVYLMGIAQNQAELTRVVGHAKDIEYVRRVVNYVRLKDDPARRS
ncbi:BON domain-containing protein [Pelagibius sp. Alg239-R121]|uniref:BON domain-containing protein n=1 Tax=Pelagibius sp. Alg239-R121 TaxID=2993448 RepID=UPI0024A661FB|nr:BON domain-containing protein [Pelagibius sp. Alg239-R121]